MNMNNHKKSHMSSSCQHCGIWVKVNSKLTHERKCSGTTKFSCELCTYTSDRMSSIKRHVKSTNKTSDTNENKTASNETRVSIRTSITISQRSFHWRTDSS